MRNFDLYFTKRWTFIFSDVCLTQCSPRESYSSNWSQHLCALPRNRCRFWRVNVLWYTTQPRFRLTELTFGRMPILTRIFSASTFQEVCPRLSVGLPRLASASDFFFVFPVFLFQGRKNNFTNLKTLVGWWHDLLHVTSDLPECKQLKISNKNQKKKKGDGSKKKLFEKCHKKSCSNWSQKNRFWAPE